jgi:hypothetical protein
MSKIKKERNKERKEGREKEREEEKKEVKKKERITNRRERRTLADCKSGGTTGVGNTIWKPLNTD